MPVVAVGKVIVDMSVDLVIQRETVKAVSMADRIGDDEVRRYLMRVKAVAGAVLDLNLIESDILVRAGLAGSNPVEPSIDLARGMGAIAVDCQVMHGYVMVLHTILVAKNAREIPRPA